MNQQKIIDDSSSFSSLVIILNEIFLSRNPVAATAMGLSEYNHNWPDISLEGIQTDISLLKSIKIKLIDLENTVKVHEEEDYQLFIWLIEFNIIELDEFRYWSSNPRLSSLIISGFHNLIIKDQFSNQNKISAINSRLDGIENLIKDIQTILTEPVDLWVKSEIRACKSLPKFLESIPDHLEMTENSKNILNTKIIKALSEINNYIHWLESLEASPKIPIKKEVYHKLIKTRKLGYNATEIENLGRYYLSKTSNELNELVDKLPGNSIDEVRELIRSKHPNSYEEVVKTYQEYAIKAKQFLIDKNLLSLPSEELEVIYTPSPLRHLLSIAAASPPGQFDDPQRGYFWVTPHDSSHMLKEHSFAYYALLISHESYPGHHLHFVCKNSNKSLVRSSIFVNPSSYNGLMYPSKLADITEGWGLYSESLMLDNGFDSQDEQFNMEKHFLQTNALRWRATRMIVDVGLHTGRFSYDEAVNYLRAQTGFDIRICKAEVLMYSQSPGYFLSYLMGRHLMMELREELEVMDIKKFHDKILYAGNVPFWFLREYIFNL